MQPSRPTQQMRLILVTGMSGSGKSVALNVLEDSGYYCVDNLPANLLASVADSLLAAGYTRVAVSVDVRSGPTLKELPASTADLRGREVDLRVLFLDAQTETLVKRFSETRRRHPLSDDTRTLPECIDAEREMLQEIGALAHRIDTSELSPNALRAWIKDFVGTVGTGMTTLFQSFGFKHGIPLDADLVFDVRCLPNPHYDPRLRPLTGKDGPVIEFLRADANAQRMLADIRHLPRHLAALLRARQPQLPDRGNRLHRRAPSLGVFRRSARGALPDQDASHRPAPGAGAVTAVWGCGWPLLGIAAALCTAPAHAADWVKVSAPDQNQHFYDRTKLFVDADAITYWRRVVFHTPQAIKGGTARMALYRERIDCRSHTHRTLGYLLYAQDGNVVENVYDAGIRQQRSRRINTQN